MTPREEVDTKLYSNDTNQLSDIFSDIGSGITDLFSRDREYTTVIALIANDLTHNDREQRSFWENFTQDGLSTVPLESIKAVLDTYINLMLSLQGVTAYNAEKTTAAKEWLTLISDKSSQNLRVVERVMNQLYWSTIQGRMPSKKYLYPKKAKQNKEYTEIPSDYQTAGILPDFGIGNYGKWIIPTVAVGALLFLGSKITSNIKEITD